MLSYKQRSNRFHIKHDKQQIEGTERDYITNVGRGCLKKKINFLYLSCILLKIKERLHE